MMKIMKFGLVIMMSLLFLFSISADGLAQEVDTEKEEKRYRLDKVIVRDHPLRDESMVVTPDVTVINVEKFQKAGRIQNIQDILSEALGVDVLRSNITPSPSEAVYIRGLDQSRIQVFMDGKPMRLMGRMGYYKIDWTTMPLDNVETIEIIRGSHSLLYPFSMGGAINIITKKGKKTDEAKPEISMTTEFGSYGAESYSANVLGGLFNRIGYSFAGASRRGDGYLRNNYYDTDNFNARISFYLPTGGTLSGGWDYVATETGYAVINDPNDSASDFNPSYPVVRTDEVDRFTHDYEGRAYWGGDSCWKKRTNEWNILVEQPLGPGELRAQVYQHQSERDRLYYTSTGVQNKQLGTKEYNMGYNLDYLDFELIKNHAFSIGGEYRTQGDRDNKDYYEIFSGYFQDVWSTTSPLTLTWGLRWYEFQSDAYRAGFPGHGPYREMSRSEQKAWETRRVETEWCPKARLDYELDPSLTLYAAVSREMRTP
jgi:outer membrane receptor for ferrienterochelin and colicin